MVNPLRSTVYVRIKPDRLSVLHVESGHEYGDVPTLAIEHKNGKDIVLGLGGTATAKAGLSRVSRQTDSSIREP